MLFNGRKAGLHILWSPEPNATLHSPNLTRVDLNFTKVTTLQVGVVLYRYMLVCHAVFCQKLGGERAILKTVYQGLIAIR